MAIYRFSPVVMGAVVVGLWQILAIYGITLPKKKPFALTCVVAAVTGGALAAQAETVKPGDSFLTISTTQNGILRRTESGYKWNMETWSRDEVREETDLRKLAGFLLFMIGSVLVYMTVFAGDGIEECYYFDGNGWMLAGTVTPDGYTVNTDGAWTENGTVATKIRRLRL